MHHDRRVVPGIHISQNAPRPIELRIEKRDEPVACDVAAQERVQPRAEFIRRQSRRSQPAHSRL